ncbi:hypothetical protein [Actinomyces sp.]|uniref:hypothetical protein n=1 Tax=Actinomyces sp. TaxID=29317 RepID=UPI0026DBDD42|nr:hypothetical protein [Actinomyces sp.]MDO4901460.1 hypothetical protein [Actinomyces sp.]
MKSLVSSFTPFTGPKALLIYTGRKDGLGNRVRALLSAKALAEREERALFYVWSTDRYFGPAMDELWQFDAGHRVPRWISRAAAPIHRFYGPGPTSITARMRAERLWQIRSGGQPVTWDDAMRPWTEDFRALVPVAEIAERVNRVFDDSLRGQRYVGVQVRSHTVSHAKTLESSPVDWFEQRMRAVREQYPDALFYLSCDTAEAQARIMNSFDGCVALTDKGGYNTTEGVRSAIVDLYLLASAQYFIAPSYSSFPEMAIHLSDHAMPFERPDQPLAEELSLDAGLVNDPLKPAIRN